MHLEEDLEVRDFIGFWKHLYEDCMCGFVGKASRFDGQIPVYSTYRCWNQPAAVLSEVSESPYRV